MKIHLPRLHGTESHDGVRLTCRGTKKNERREKIHFGYSLSWHLKYMAYLYYPLEREISDFSLIHIKKKYARLMDLPLAIRFLTARRSVYPLSSQVTRLLARAVRFRALHLRLPAVKCHWWAGSLRGETWCTGAW
jgi:hypothetical protein